MKKCGVLLHIASLPGRFGIGDLGNEAYRFVDWLSLHGQKYWQILPINFCGYGNSPYNPISSFSSFPYLISPELLYDAGLISIHELNSASLPCTDSIDYELVYEKKNAIFEIACKSYLATTNIDSFITRKALYLKPLMAFLTLSAKYQNSKWYQWDTHHRSYCSELFDDLMISDWETMMNVACLQAIFDDQYNALKQYAETKGIEIIGDMPLYVSYESADVWANQELFSLDASGDRIKVAGVPPDAFSDEGQLWGNPVFIWDQMQKDGFRWFRDRISNALNYYDLLRLDHFIGYVNYWEVDAKENTAIHGLWKKALPTEFFTMLSQDISAKRIIAEDLGILTDEVVAIRDTFAFPGMIVLQFCFDDGVPDILSYSENMVIYTGTHDNPTTRGWFLNLCETKPNTTHNVWGLVHEQQLSIRDNEELQERICELMIRWAYSSPCNTVIIPMQDILCLDDNSRMNIPGTAQGNWQWRLPDTEILKKRNELLIHLSLPMN